MSNNWLPTILLLVPLIGALFVWVVPMPRDWAGPTALVIALAELALWIVLVTKFDFSQPGLQFPKQHTWFSDLHVSYAVGAYPFTVWLVGMTIVVLTASIAYAIWVGRDRPVAFFGLMLFLLGAVIGVFVALDLLLFYVFWEAMLIPLYFLMGVWGGAGRLGATLKFVIYTMAGSLLMLASVIALGLSQGTFDMLQLHGSDNDWIFLGFMAAFIVKAPLFPFHGWLPDAYRESPAEVSAVLSGVVSKAAAYGFFFIAIRFFAQPTQDFRIPVLVLASIGLVYGSLLAFRAPDFRGVVAYSSLAQMSLITFGVFATNLSGLSGAFLQIVNHGLISASLFLLAGAIERRSRTATGSFAELGGMARGRPALATVLMIVGVIALAVPGSSAFAGEFLILAGVLTSGWAWTVIGTIAIVLAAMYMLRLISAVLHRQPGNAATQASSDLRPAELLILVPLVGCLLALSAWPASITDRTFGDVTTQPPLVSIYTEPTQP